MRWRVLLGLWPLPVLCVLVVLRSMLVSAWPEAQSTPCSQAAALVLVSLGCALLVAIRSRRRRSGSTPRDVSPVLPEGWRRSMLGACLLFGGMAANTFAGVYGARSTDLLVALTLTPIVIAVALVPLRNDAQDLDNATLVLGLAGCAGALLLFPQPELNSAPATAVLILTPLLIGIGSVLLASDARELTLAKSACAAGAGAVLLLPIGMALAGLRTSLPLPAALDGALDAVTLLALARLGALTFAARFAGVPLLLLLVGLAVEPVPLNLRQIASLVLLAAVTAALAWHGREGAPGGLPR